MRSRVVLLAMGVCLGVGVLVLASRRAGANILVVPTPSPGSAVAAFLPDGHPVFVATDLEGQVSVVDAISTHRPFGIGYLVGWCRQSETFDDPFHGSRFAADGRYLLGPAATDLPTYAFAQRGGDVVVGDEATIPTQRTVRHSPRVGPPCTRDRLTQPRFDGATWITATAAVAAGDGWSMVTGELRVAPTGSSLCDGERCVALPAASGVEGGPFSLHGRWLVHVATGTIAQVVAVAVTP